MAQDAGEISSAYAVVFDGLDYLGPGDSATTREIAERLRSELRSVSRVADFGCGVGASALVLAKSLPEARILALDSHPQFIARLVTAANAAGLGDRISATVGDMADPPDLDGVKGDFDLIWCESAIYAIGRVNAFRLWRPLLRRRGMLVFSDVVWHCEPSERSDEAIAYWEKEYPDIATAATVLDQMVAASFAPLDPLTTGRKPWLNYYEPLRNRIRLLARQRYSPQALVDLIAELEREIDLFDSVGDQVDSCIFRARRIENAK